MRKRIKKTIQGFTLVEILIVVGILAVMLGITLVAVNPLEQINRASDVAAKATAEEVSKATNTYLATAKTLPWKKNEECRDELSQGTTMDQLDNCMEEISQSSDLKTKVLSSNESKDIYVNECADAIAMCYDPKSKTYSDTSEVKYTKNGVINPDCLDGTSDECYACSFSANNAQECFQSLNPNGKLALSEDADPKSVVPISDVHSKKACDTPGGPGEAMCAADVVTNADGDVISSLGVVGGLSPIDVHTAYNLPCRPGGPIQSVCETPASFGPQTIGIVIAYHAPTLEYDLGVFSSTYNLPPCTKANGCLTVVNQNGATSPVPPQNDLWALEAALDVQVAHMVCQTCKILLVEANSNYMSDLAIAIQRAALMGATVISNSYGAPEWSAQSLYDSYVNKPGVYVTAATGDWGYGAYYPASSARVIAVGGTTLSIHADSTYASESVWSGTGSGCSSIENANSFQSALSIWSSTGCGSRRAISDVSAVADPHTGVGIFNSTPYDGMVGWYKVGGTSLSSPLVAAALAMWNGAPATGNAPSILYANTQIFRDVTSGSNGGCSNSIMCNGKVGYDGPTGLGSIKLLADPVGSPTPMPPTNTPTPTVIPESIKPAPVTTLTATFNSMIVLRWSGTTDNAAVKEYQVYMDTLPAHIPIAVKGGPKADDTANTYELGVSYRPNETHVFTVRAIDTSGNYSDAIQNVTVNTSGVTPTPTITPTPTQPANGYMNITYPSGGEIFTAGQTIRITWDTNVASGCNLTYVAQSTGMTVYYNIGNPNAATKYFDWKVAVPANLSAPQNERVAIICAGAPQDYSDGFFIVNATGSSPTPIQTCGTRIQTSLFSQPTMMFALPGDTVNNTLIVKNHDPANCSMTYTIQHGFPFVLTQNGIPTSVTIAGGETKSLPFTIKIGSSATPGNYVYNVWVNKQGETTAYPISNSIQVTQQTPTTTPTPTPSPTPVPSCGSTMQTVSLSQSDPALALPGDTVNNTLIVKNNDPANCSMSYTISYGFPTVFTPNGIPPSFTIAGGETKYIPFTVKVGATATAGNYIYQFWVAKQGQSSASPVNGSIQVAQVGPTNTPTPTPVVCNVSWTNTLGSTSMSANAGDTLQQTLTITNTSSAGCGTFQFTISYAYPTGWVINNLPASVNLAAGQSTTIPFTITVSSGAQVQDYTLQFWPQFGSFSNPNIPLNATVHVLSTGQPPQQQMFSNFGGKFYGNYATFEYSYNANGAVATRLDVATDPSLLTQTSGTNANARYGFAFSSGNAWDASNQATPTTIRGFINSSPSSWSGWKCGNTIYYRIYNSGDLRIYSPVQTAVVDCVTQVNVLPWEPWYAAIYQGVYDSRYDADNNGVINYTDYWKLVRATRLR